MNNDVNLTKPAGDATTILQYKRLRAVFGEPPSPPAGHAWLVVSDYEIAAGSTRIIPTPRGWEQVHPQTSAADWPHLKAIKL